MREIRGIDLSVLADQGLEIMAVKTRMCPIKGTCFEDSSEKYVQCKWYKGCKEVMEDRASVITKGLSRKFYFLTDVECLYPNSLRFIKDDD